MKNKFVYRYKTKKAKIDKQTYNPKSHHTIHLSKTQQLYETTCKHTFIPQYSREKLKRELRASLAKFYPYLDGNIILINPLTTG